jgi:DnaJ-class molecular chaperone
MGIWDRLGNLIKSYLNDEDARLFGGRSASGDPDLDAAFEELNDYLDGRAAGRAGDAPAEDSAPAGGPAGGRYAKPVPEALRPDFAELGVPFGASAEECKAAYKKLLKIHHPDRHAGHEGNFKKATARTARINAAYDRIERWRQE